MKKTYNAPELNIVEVRATMLAGSDPTIGVDQSKGTNQQLSKKYGISFDNDDEDMSYDW